MLLEPDDFVDSSYGLDVAVLVTSHDGFADCWPAALELFAKYWGDCPWPLLTTSGTIPWGPRCLLTGKLPWVPAMQNALSQIEDEFGFVLAYLDDMLPCAPVKTGDCWAAYNMMIAHGRCGAFRLGQGVEPCHQYFYDVWEINRDAPYRISTSPTLWRISYLKAVLENCGESAWEFETKGTDFAQSLADEVWTLYGTDDTQRPIKTYYTAITRGKWNRGCLNWLREIGIPEPDISRGVVENERGPL